MDNFSFSESVVVQIKNFTDALLRRYEDLRVSGFLAQELDLPPSAASRPGEAFWDVVVLTACDEDQESAFVKQLERKVKRGELPRCCYQVVVDVPAPGCKLGSGGSTLLVIEHLKKTLPSKDFAVMKVLIIHAGGWSQRLPSASVLGKLFMPLPFGDHNYDMLDIKLALYLPFLPNMLPGIFITASDDIELYSFIATETVKTKQFDGFVALGHPSSLQIGSTHGVYVCEGLAHTDVVTFSPCLQVLQKPAVEDMFSAVVQNQSAGDQTTSPYVVSDSAYWFDMNIVDKLHQFFRKNGIPHDEVDAYGDFLQPLGKQSNERYIQRTKNPVLQKIRKSLFDCLHDSFLHVLFLPHSQFFHLGTMPEYLENVLRDDLFRRCFNITETVMHSVVHEKSLISDQSVLEYCNFICPVNVGSDCFISCCSSEAANTWTNDCLEILDGAFMHTVVLDMNGQRCYATIFCGVTDDIKAEVSVEKAGDLKIFGIAIDPYLKRNSSIIPTDSSSVSIWTLKMFKTCTFPGQSFVESLRTIQHLRGGQMGISTATDASGIMVSMGDILLYKDINGMLQFRERFLLPCVSSFQAAHQIFGAGVSYVKPDRLIPENVKTANGLLQIFDLAGVERFSSNLNYNVYLLGAGKAALGMFTALHVLLGKHVKGGLLIVPSEFRKNMGASSRILTETVQVLYGGKNNLPDEESVESTKKLVDFVRSVRSPDIIVCAVSGGASALLVAPVHPITLEAEQWVVNNLGKCGARISELNIVRGSLSEVKCGRLLQYVDPGVKTASVILSDIIGDPVELIGGAPTVPSNYGRSEAVSVLKRYDLWEGAPHAVKDVLLQRETTSIAAADICNVLIGNNHLAVAACREKAEKLGYQTIILTECLQGAAKEAALLFVDIVKQVARYRDGGSPTVTLNAPFATDFNVDWNGQLCFLSAGETTVTVTGDGKGGRNQEMVLAFAIALQEVITDYDIAAVHGSFFSGGTDGQDGPTDATGAVTEFPASWTPGMLTASKNALLDNDSYGLFDKNRAVGSLVKTGFTGTNVMDLQILIIDF